MLEDKVYEVHCCVGINEDFADMHHWKVIRIVLQGANDLLVISIKQLSPKDQDLLGSRLVLEEVTVGDKPDLDQVQDPSITNAEGSNY